MAPPDPILSTAIAFKNDTHPKKVNLGIGAYRDNDGKPVVLDSVREAEIAIANDKNEVKEYAPIDGAAPNKELVQTLVFGAGSSIVSSGRTRLDWRTLLRECLQLSRHCSFPTKTRKQPKG